jgi:hypothetical protein
MTSRECLIPAYCEDCHPRTFSWTANDCKGWNTGGSAATVSQMSERGGMHDPKAANRLGCLLVLLPALALFIVMPDAIHVWQAPWSNPLLWLLACIVSWLGLRWLIERTMSALRQPARFLVCGLLLAASVLIVILILRSV